MSAFSQHLLTENGPFSPLMEAVENKRKSNGKRLPAPDQKAVPLG